MKFSVAVVLLLLVLSGTAKAELIVLDSQFEHFQRGNFLAFALAVDDQARIHVVTSTSTNARLRRINLDNSVTTLNSHVGVVIGVRGNMDFGFGDDLFSNAMGQIRRFAIPGGAGSAFVTGSMDHTGGLAFDAVNQKMWVGFGDTTNSTLESYNAAGTLVDTISLPGITSLTGLVFDPLGDLLVINGGKGRGIRRVNTATSNVDLLTDLSGVNNAANIVTLKNGDIFYGASIGVGPYPYAVHRIGSDGSGLRVIASNAASSFSMAVGPSGDGSGGESIYLTSANVSEINELRFTPVPEPSSIALLGIGAVSLFGYQTPNSTGTTSKSVESNEREGRANRERRAAVPFAPALIPASKRSRTLSATT